MATINYFSEVDVPQLSFSAVSPDTTPADPGAASPTTFSIDIDVTCTSETITGVDIDFGDTNVTAATPSGSTYSADNSYLLAGVYPLTAVVTMSGGTVITSPIYPITVT